MSDTYGYRTTIVLDTVHEPTETELTATLEAVLDTGEQQGYEPFEAQALPANPRKDLVTADRPRIKHRWRGAL